MMDQFKKRFSRSNKQPADADDGIEESATVADEGTKNEDKSNLPDSMADPNDVQKESMVPIFSWRTVIVVAIGAVVGIALALGYWVLSPSFSLVNPSSIGTSTGNGTTGPGGLAGILGVTPTGTYESTLRIQIVSPGSEYVPLATLRQYGEYYAAKANSLPFLNHLATEANAQSPSQIYSVDSLSDRIYMEYDYNQTLPSIIATVQGNSETEVAFLVELVPRVFRQYLTEEEETLRQKEYENTLLEIDTVKEALYTAQQELSSFSLEDIANNPQYILLSAKLDTLEAKLELQVSQLLALDDANMFSPEDEYQQVIEQLDQLEIDLTLAQQDLAELESKTDESLLANQLLLESKIRAFRTELDRYMTGYNVGNQTYTGLAELIANGITDGPTYDNLMVQVERVSSELASAETRLDELNEQINNVAETLEYKLTRLRVDTYLSQQEMLQEQLVTLYSQKINEGQDETELQEQFTKTAADINTVKEQINELESQVGYDRLTSGLEYSIAQDKVDTLNSRLNTLTNQLGTLVGGNTATSITDYLVSGTPTVPSPIYPERPSGSSTLLMGLIGGVIVSWIALNYKWIRKQLRSAAKSSQTESQEEE